MVKAEIWKCCKGQPCGSSQDIILDKLQDYDAVYNTITIIAWGKGVAYNVVVEQSSALDFADIESVTIPVPASGVVHEHVPIHLPFIRVRWNGAANSEMRVCRMLSQCCEDDLDYIETIIGWLEQIYLAIDTLEVSIDNIEIDADQINLNTDQLEALVQTIINRIDLAIQPTLNNIWLAASGIDTDIDVALSTRASEATLAAILAKLDVALSTRASEATLQQVLTALTTYLSGYIADNAVAVTAGTPTYTVNVLGTLGHYGTDGYYVNDGTGAIFMKIDEGAGYGSQVRIEKGEKFNFKGLKVKSLEWNYIAANSNGRLFIRGDL